MSAGEWKRGAVAMVNDDVCLRVEGFGGWEHGRNDRLRYPSDADARPLALIDPESDDADRLADLLTQSLTANDVSPAFRIATRAALREFAKPTPPKPEEPTGLGAVVEDEDGELWVQFRSKSGMWWRCNQGVNYRWEDLAAVRVLSEGVS